METLTAEDIEIDMPGFITKTVENKEVVFYNIKLKLKGNIWKLKKRFSQFDALHK